MFIEVTRVLPTGCTAPWSINAELVLYIHPDPDTGGERARIKAGCAGRTLIMCLDQHEILVTESYETVREKIKEAQA